MESKFVNLNLEKMLAEFPVGSVAGIKFGIYTDDKDYNKISLVYDITLNEPTNVGIYSNVKNIRDKINMSLDTDKSKSQGMKRAIEFIDKVKEQYQFANFRSYN